MILKHRKINKLIVLVLYWGSIVVVLGFLLVGKKEFPLDSRPKTVVAERFPCTQINFSNITQKKSTNFGEFGENSKFFLSTHNGYRPFLEFFLELSERSRLAHICDALVKLQNHVPSSDLLSSTSKSVPYQVASISNSIFQHSPTRLELPKNFLVTEKQNFPYNEILSVADTKNYSKKIQKLQSPKDFRFLVGLGLSVEGHDSFVLSDSGSFSDSDNAIKALKTYLLQFLSLEFNSSLDQGNLAELNECLYQLGHSFLDDLSIELSGQMKNFGLSQLHFTPFSKMENRPDRSGLSAVGSSNQEVFITRKRLASFFQGQNAESKIAKTQNAITSFQNFAKTISLQQKKETNVTQLQKHVKDAYDSLTGLGFFEKSIGVLPNREAPKRSLTRETSLPNLQIYSKPIPGLGLNLSGAYSVMNQSVSVGLGKVRFFPAGDRDFGWIMGLDCGLKFNCLNNSFFNYRYGGLSARTFVGLGFRV